MLECKICKQILKDSPNSLANHLYFSHKDMTKQQYYDLYLKKEEEGHCLVCESQTEFLNINKGYKPFCSKSCSTKKSWENDEERKELFKQNMMGNGFSVPGIRKGTKNKNPYPKNSPKNIEKFKKLHDRTFEERSASAYKAAQTKIEKYGEAHFINQFNKIIQNKPTSIPIEKTILSRASYHALNKLLNISGSDEEYDKILEAQLEASKA